MIDTPRTAEAREAQIWAMRKVDKLSYEQIARRVGDLDTGRVRLICKRQQAREIYKPTGCAQTIV